MIPIWVFAVACLLFIGILIHQNNKLQQAFDMHRKTWKILNKYVDKYGIDKTIVPKLEE